MLDSEEEDVLFLQIAVLMRLNKKYQKLKNRNIGSEKSFVNEKKMTLYKLISINKVVSFVFLRYFVKFKVNLKGVLSSLYAFYPLSFSYIL